MSQLKVNSVVDAGGGNTATINTYTPTESNMGGKNRIINGDMRIDQRNAGASVNGDNAKVFALDRFFFIENASTTPTLQQVSDAPDGFSNSFKFTNAASTATPGYAQLVQIIEGYNVSDFNFGTAAAKTVTLSFWVKSSVTGQFSVSLRNSAADRSNVSTYTVNSASTWEYKTITFVGDTTGTWLKTNGGGLDVIWRSGGSGGTSTLNQWIASGEAFASGSVNIMGTASSTWQITGVQLEVGSVATPFERRPYGTELALCQRYFEKSYIQTDAVGAANKGGYTMSPVGSNTVPLIQGYAQICFAVVKRADPTITIYGYQGGSGKVSNAQTGADLAASSGLVNASGTQGFNGYNGSGGTLTTAQYAIIYHWTASIEL